MFLIGMWDRKAFSLNEKQLASCRSFQAKTLLLKAYISPSTCPWTELTGVNIKPKFLVFNTAVTCDLLQSHLLFQGDNGCGTKLGFPGSFGTRTGHEGVLPRKHPASGAGLCWEIWSGLVQDDSAGTRHPRSGFFLHDVSSLLPPMTLPPSHASHRQLQHGILTLQLCLLWAGSTQGNTRIWIPLLEGSFTDFYSEKYFVSQMLN